MYPLGRIYQEDRPGIVEKKTRTFNIQRSSGTWKLEVTLATAGRTEEAQADEPVLPVALSVTHLCHPQLSVKRSGTLESSSLCPTLSGASLSHVTQRAPPYKR
ncbi:hypothetical protein NDU88_005451 [Pleurodeles waltl]|uniref:Uncharacterized protein n=1 Tax=Pleurodeles waltl TaxID=8319 RepID=A0AAV7PIW5_PLEWA|nr:hypothetical protein NDU88_005451 [Pleurodeles waltl]